MQQRGFTLIELIIVIVILGILAVTAAPRFINLSEDAREAAMEGVFGAVKSASQIAHASLLINQTGNVIAEGVDIQTDPDGDGFGDAGDRDSVNDYPHAEDICDLIGLHINDGLAAVQGADDTSDSLLCTPDGTNAVDITDEDAATPANCSVRYVEAAGANLAPTITIDTTACN